LYIIPVAFLSLFMSISVSFYILSTTPIYISGKNLADYNFKQYYLKQHPLSVYYRTYEFMYYKYRTNKFKKEKDSFKFNVTNPKDTLKPKIVVLIIGERTRYSNWSINGYSRETNPCLREQQNLISFSNNFSNANCTANSIPLIITQATPQIPDLAFKQKTIVSLFKEAGYETIWISSQANCFDFIDNKNEMDQLFEVYNTKNHTDLDIIPIFKNVVNKKPSKNKFIVINMLGGHGKIPKKFELFSPNSSHKDYPVTFSNSHIFINDYDNMICLQDFVLSELIKATDKQSLSSLLLFTADHGCNLFDNGKILFGYGSTNPTKKETHVPLIVWASDKFIKSNTKFNILNKHKKMLTTNNNIFYTLADLSNIKYKSFVKTKSISDSSFIEPTSRFVFVNNCSVAFKKDNN
jgi:glucan phosphoethanolaminetransferase (alkaline phosphatase superfamily)